MEEREKLIRAHFDAYSDLQWVTDLETKFKQYHLTAAEMKGYREAWNRHTEARDWDWWQEKVKGVSDAELRQDIAECHAQIAAFREERRDALHTVGDLDDMFNQYASRADDSSRELEKGPER